MLSFGAMSDHQQIVSVPPPGLLRRSCPTNTRPLLCVGIPHHPPVNDDCHEVMNASSALLETHKPLKKARIGATGSRAETYALKTHFSLAQANKLTAVQE